MMQTNVRNIAGMLQLFHPDSIKHALVNLKRTPNYCIPRISFSHLLQTCEIYTYNLQHDLIILYPPNPLNWSHVAFLHSIKLGEFFLDSQITI